jgi:DNA adenine methylase
MQYLGGKSKTRKQISAYLESVRNGMDYFEPFVGGAWVLQEMSGKRIASDGNDALITMYKSLQGGWVPPDYVSEAEYQAVRVANNPTDPMTIFCGIGCSFAGKIWGGYARSADKNCYAKTSKNSLLKQLPLIKDVDFQYGLFHEHNPENMLVYCDPPYEGTTQYGAFKSFDHTFFWNTMREWSKKNTVIISEYKAPEDFKCVAEFNSQMGMTTGKERPVRVERLFVYNGI